MEKEEQIGESKEATPPSEEVETKVETNPQEENTNNEVETEDAIASEAEKLANIKIAVASEEARLREIRKKQKLAKLGVEVNEEEELPQIDRKDPSAKAWMKEIDNATLPAKQELEKAKEERRLFTLRKFLGDKPALAKNPEKLKAMMETYERINTSTELTEEGIMMNLEKAYAAEHYDELINKGRQERIEKAKNDAIFSDPAVSRGSTTYSNDKSKKQREYSDDEKQILAKWGMTPAEHAALNEAMAKE